MKAAKDASGERSAEEDQLRYGGWDHPSGAYLRPPLHFAQRISDTAAVYLDYLLQRGIRTLTFIEVVHVLGAWNEEKDQILRQANASGRTEHGVIANFMRLVMAVAVRSLSGDRPRFPFDVNRFLYDASGVLNTEEVQAVAKYSEVSASMHSTSTKHSTRSLCQTICQAHLTVTSCR